MASWKEMARMALPVGVSLFFLAVPPQGRCAEESGAQIEITKETQPAEAAPQKGVEGVATYYAKRYKGKKTTSGQRYRPEKFTGAHPHLPLGTKVQVTHLESGRQVVVTINDRCRKRRFNIIDLSRAAAREIGLLGKGRARVRIECLDEAPLPVAQAAVPASQVTH
jgi:rare lipoprotein A